MDLPNRMLYHTDMDDKWLKNLRIEDGKDDLALYLQYSASAQSLSSNQSALSVI